MAVSDKHKSQDWYEGYTTALVFVSDIFEKHRNAFIAKKLLRKIDVELVLNILDACIRRREVLAEGGPTGVDLFVSKRRTASLKEK